ncbi:MAG: hypothetical protein ACRDNW_03180 [Trebonia sp.]
MRHPAGGSRAIGLPSDFERRLTAVLPVHGGLPPSVEAFPYDRHERPCAAGNADHYEVHARYAAAGESALDSLEGALKALPGVYATTQVRDGRRADGGRSWRNTFTNPAWPGALGTERPNCHELRPQVLALIRAEKRTGEAPEPSIFRCAECGHGDQLRGWVHVNAHGPVGASGVIEHYDYWSEDADEIIEESITCRIHGEGSVEKLVGGQYTSTMVGGKYVAAPPGNTSR